MDLKLPNLGEGADSGTVVNLFVKEGDAITKDQPILELENEKAVATIPSTAAGTVSKVYVKPGDKLSVGQRILSLADGGGPGAATTAAAEPAPASRRERIIQTPSPEQAPEPGEEEAPDEGEERKGGGAPAAAPSIRKLARDLGIDLTRVRGSARGGRIVLEDVRAYIQRLQRARGGTEARCGGRGGACQATAGASGFLQMGPDHQDPLLSPAPGHRPPDARKLALDARASPSSTRPTSPP